MRFPSGGSSRPGKMGFAKLSQPAPTPTPTPTPEPTYDTDAAAYFAAMTVQPPSDLKVLVNDFIVGLKADGYWAKFDWICLPLDDVQSSLVNARAPSKAASALGSLTFTPRRGFKGDGSTGYIDIGEPWSNAPNFVRNSAFFGLWTNLAGAGASVLSIMGEVAGTATRIIRGVTGSGDTFVINDATTSAGQTSPSTTGHRMAMRTATVNKRYFWNGTQVAALSVTSTGVGTTNGCVLRGNTAFNADRVAAFYSGGPTAGVTGDSESAPIAASIHARLSTFLTAIGAA